MKKTCLAISLAGCMGMLAAAVAADSPSSPPSTILPARDGASSGALLGAPVAHLQSIARAASAGRHEILSEVFLRGRAEILSLGLNWGINYWLARERSISGASNKR